MVLIWFGNYIFPPFSDFSMLSPCVMSAFLCIVLSHICIPYCSTYQFVLKYDCVLACMWFWKKALIKNNVNIL